MLVIVAIDIINGNCVRLTKGDFKGEIDEFGDPIELAKRWENRGAQYLSIIDLDGAKDGKVRNLDALTKIVSSVDVPVQFGGGLRTKKEIRDVLSVGVSRVIIGTRALEDTTFLKEIINEFGNNRIIVSLDVREKKTYGRGWKKGYEKKIDEILLELENADCKRILLTSIEQDGGMMGPDLSLLMEISKITNMKIIFAGGISKNEDITKIEQTKLAEAVVVGKAIYLGKIDLKVLK